MLLHKLDTNQRGQRRYSYVKCVVVLAVSMAKIMHNEDELWIAFGTSKE